MTEKITIIGGSGFIGTNFCQVLSDSKTPFEIIDIKKSRRFPGETKIGDVRDIQSLSNTISGDIVVNLAAVHRDDVREITEYYDTNVTGAENVIEVCRVKNIKKIIFTSTVAVYGFAKPDTGEDGLINPFNEYGRSKYTAEEKFRNWQLQEGNSLIIIRPTVVFGDGNRGNVFNLFNYIFSKRFIMIGSGTNKKSLAYVENVAAFLQHCSKINVDYAIVNYIDTPNMDMNSLVSKVQNTLNDKPGVGLRLPYWLGLFVGFSADCISKITNIRLPISYIRVQKFSASTSFTSCKEKLMGFETPITLDTGIDKTLKSEFLDVKSDKEVFYSE